jgi:hypothetical protein
MIPEASAGWFSLLTFNWITPILSVGYARPLVTADLYELQQRRSSTIIADKIIASYDKRAEDARVYNERLEKGEISPGWRKVWWTLRGNVKERERMWKEGRKRANLALALNDAIFWWFWTGAILKFIADMAQIASPLLVKVRKSVS